MSRLFTKSVAPLCVLGAHTKRHIHAAHYIAAGRPDVTAIPRSIREGAGWFSNLLSAGKRLVGSFLRSDAVKSMASRAANAAAEVAKEAAVTGARSLAERISQTPLAAVVPPQQLVSAAEALNTAGPLQTLAAAALDRSAKTLGSGTRGVLSRLRRPYWNEGVSLDTNAG